MGRARYDWERIRAGYEAGDDAATISARHGIGKAAVSRRAKREGWAVAGTAGRAAAEPRAGAGDSPDRAASLPGLAKAGPGMAPLPGARAGASAQGKAPASTGGRGEATPPQTPARPEGTAEGRPCTAPSRLGGKGGVRLSKAPAFTGGAGENRPSEAPARPEGTAPRPGKPGAAIASAADGKTAVILRHREEWDGQGRLIAEAVEGRDMEAVKLAKLVAETLKIRQEAERKAWGIRDVDAQPDGGALTVRIVRVSGETAAGAADAAARP